MPYYITKESKEKFVHNYVLTEKEITEITNDTVTSGVFNVIHHIDMTHELNFMPFVLAQIINDYYNDVIVIDYTLHYPHSIKSYFGSRHIMLSISNNELEFNHDIYCGSYFKSRISVLKPCISNPRICNNIYPLTNSYNTSSYNTHIRSDYSLQDWVFNFGLFFDYINSVSLFGAQKSNVIASFNRIDNVVNVNLQYTYLNECTNELYKITILNEDKLNTCIKVHEVIFELLNLVNTYYNKS